MNWTRTNAINVACTLRYILDGFGTAAFGELAIYNGHVNTTLDFADYAALSEELLAKFSPDDYPGVYDYEVSEPFGRWLYTEYQTNGYMPPRHIAAMKLIELIADFFAQRREVIKQNIIKELTK